jgi:hypothetical protein
VLVGGHDFFASPRLSPDGRSLIWLAWTIPTCRGMVQHSTSPDST